MLRPVQENEIELRASSIPGAGTGLFAKKKLKAGTMLKYVAILYKVNEIEENTDETYFMSVRYTENDISKCARNTIGNGDPSIPPMNGMKKVDTACSYINEASIMPPNCIFVANEHLTKADIKKYHKESKPVSIAYMIIPFDIEIGEELFTTYGSSYGREYKVWRDRHGYRGNLENVAQEMVDGKVKYIHDMFNN